MGQTFLTVLLVGTILYTVVCAILYLNQERLMFFPEVLPADFRYSFRQPFEEVNWQVDGAVINALHFKVDQPKGAVLFLHGNAGSLRGWGTVAADFVTSRYDVLMPDYRGYGKSTGKISGERMLHEDALVAYNYLRQHYREEQIVIYGRSLGTAIAVNLARSTQPKLLILETPYVSFKELAHRQFPFVPGFLLKYPMRTDKWISDVSCPIYLVHGTHDELIPYHSSERLLPLIRSKHELITIAGGGHNNLANFDEYHAALKRILQ